jgi:hypothetical protein
MKRLGSLVVFLAVGLTIAWFTRYSGRPAGETLLIALVPAFVAAWLFEKFIVRRTDRKP